jgi:hypothetical protein
MNSLRMRKQALATREAHIALLDLKKLVDDATQTTHAAELEAVHLAIRPHPEGDTSVTLRVVLERLRSANFEATLSQVREKLEMALSFHHE